MRHRDALKVRVGDCIYMKPIMGPQVSFIVTGIDNGPGSDPQVKYPLFKISGGYFTYLLVQRAIRKNYPQISAQMFPRKETSI